MPFSYRFTLDARQSLLDATSFAAQFGPETESAFVRAFAGAVSAACDATAPRHALDETGSLAFSRPVFLRLFATAKKRTRRSSAGVWRLYYTMEDADSDKKPDQVLILRVAHGAAQPLTAWLDEPHETDATDNG